MKLVEMWLARTRKRRTKHTLLREMMHFLDILKIKNTTQVDPFCVAYVGALPEAQKNR